MTVQTNMNTPHFFARGAPVDIMPLVHRLHDDLPDFLPDWIKWSLLALLGMSLFILIRPLAKRIQQWWND
jgi:hypothetical protein